jgi:CzcA family heavy metal efflux pump
MLRWLISTSIQLRIVLLALCVVLLAAGYEVLRRAPLDVFPEFAPPIVEIQTEAPGLSSEQTESLVTIPLEMGLTGIPKVTTVRSKSVLGLSQVVLVLEHGADYQAIRQMVQEKVAHQARQLPAIARPPVILQPLSSTSRVMKIGLSSRTLSQQELTILTTWTIRPKLMAVRGVANVAVWGQRDRQFQVLVDPDRLRTAGVTLDAIVRASRDATSLETGGFLDTPNQRMAVRHVSAVQEPADLARAIVDFRGGAPIHLGDVAEVTLGSPPAIGNAVINDQPGLLLIVEKQPEGNTLDVTHDIEKALEALAPLLKEVEVDPHIFRPATFIERALHNLASALTIGCVLVTIVLVAFLFDWRTALISLTAIPLSLIAAILILSWVGATINTMVLAGLVIALGELVDDAIIDVENIVRRLRINAEVGSPQSAFKVVLDASLEVRSAVVYASLIVTLVFLPIFFLEGLSGAFFRPLALAYIFAIMASLVVALTVTPALAYMLLTGQSAIAKEAPLARWLKQLYRPLLPKLIARPQLSVVLLVASFVVSLAVGAGLGREFLPNFQETDFLMHFVEKPGTSVDAMTRLTIQASKDLRAIPGVKSFGSHIGRAEVADEVVGPNFTELWISVDENANYQATLHEIEDVVYSYPGLYRDVLTYLRERIKEVLTGTSSAIVVRLYGPDLEMLRAKAKEIEKAMGKVAGVVNLKVESQVVVPQVEVVLRPEAAERFGLTAAHVRQASTTLLKGNKVGEVFDGQKRFDVVVWGVPGVRSDLAAIQALPVDTPAGMQVRLGDVADVAVVPTPNEIKREYASRRLDITCNVADRDLGAVAEEIAATLKTIAFDREYRPEMLGEYAARQQSTQRLWLLSVASMVGIVLLLYIDFQAWRPTLIVALTIPFALVGGIFAVAASGGVISLGSLVGFVTVLGIAARNGIMMVSHFRHLELEEGVPFGPELILQGCLERLTPILMTALTTGLALVPLVMAGNKPGHEIEYPLAVVILGGLVSSTLLNLVFMPALYTLAGASALPAGRASV